MRTFRVAFFHDRQHPLDAQICVDSPRPIMRLSQPMDFASAALAMYGLQRASLEARIVADNAWLDQLARQPNMLLLVAPPKCHCDQCQAGKGAELNPHAPPITIQPKPTVILPKASPEFLAVMNQAKKPLSPDGAMLLSVPAAIAKKVLAWFLGHPTQPDGECHGK